MQRRPLCGGSGSGSRQWQRRLQREQAVAAAVRMQMGGHMQTRRQLLVRGGRWRCVAWMR